MKKLQFRYAFGNFRPGDVIEVEDSAEFDHLYLFEAPEDPKPKKKPADTPADTPLYPKKD